MSVSHDDIQEVLKSLGCRMIHQVKKVVEYMMPGTKELFYVHRENQFPQIVIRSALEVFNKELASIEGVISKDAYYHNADMTRFLSRLHTGKTEVHYRLSYKFKNNFAVEKCINKVIGIVCNS